MIDIAVIASVPHLGQLSAMGSIDMALTHIALAHPDYAAYFHARAQSGGTVMLDNSAFEMEDTTGRGMPAAPVLEAAAMVGATEVICQDVLYQSAATIEATRRFLDQATDSNDMPLRFMGVPQGSTHAEWLACYHALVKLPGIDVIGLSKLSVPRCWGAPIAEARLACVAELSQHGAPKLLHLLGGDRSLPWELREHRRRGHTKLVRSCDSSFAFWYAALGIPVDPVSGRATHEAPTKPDLNDGPLDSARLAIATGHVRLLRDAAGLTPTRHLP